MKKSFCSLLILLAVNYRDLFSQWQLTGLKNVQDTCKNICSIATNGSNIFAGNTEGKVYRSLDNGISWQRILNLYETNNAYKIYSLTVNDNNVFVGTQKGIYLSRDNGSTWREALAINKTVYSIVTSGTNVFAGTNQGLYLSTNNGISWRQVDNILNNSSIYTLGFSNSVLYAGFGNGKLNSIGGIYISSDLGSNWTPILEVNNLVTNLAVNGVNIFASTDTGKVYLSTNNGYKWTPANVGVIYPTVWSTSISGNNIYTATEYGGVYVSTDFGNTWGMESDRLIFDKITSLNINNQYVFVGTYDKGLWRRLISDVLKLVTSIDTKGMSKIPINYHLEQNYPNPFNPTTKIQFSLPKSVNVRLSIYNLLGQEISTLIDQELPAGTHLVDFNASKLSNGIYFYKISAGDYSATKKMILVK